MKKMFVSGVAVFLCTALFVMPVSAHGHHGCQTESKTDCEQLCEVCTEEDCTETGWHIHDDVTYCGYDHESGYCDGTCDVVEVCTEDGCQKTGRHKHNGEIFCGYDHESGYCDQSCAKRKSSGAGRQGRHHGHH